MEKYDGEFSGLGMILGVLIGLAFGRFLLGFMLESFVELQWIGQRIYGMTIMTIKFSTLVCVFLILTFFLNKWQNFLGWSMILK
ncbi:hypothetical protein L3X09_04710 [Enterococcus faecium]|nr:hypothetical protein [Enterococcus faecium]